MSPNTSQIPKPSKKGGKRVKESALPKSRKKRVAIETESSGSEYELLEVDSEYTFSQHGQPLASDGGRAISASPSLQSRSMESRSFRESPSRSHGMGAADSVDITLNLIDTIRGKRVHYTFGAL